MWYKNPLLLEIHDHNIPWILITAHMYNEKQWRRAFFIEVSYLEQSFLFSIRLPVRRVLKRVWERNFFGMQVPKVKAIT